LENLNLVLYRKIIYRFLFQLTHNQHHKNTNNIDKDEVFYPQRGVSHEPSFMDDLLFWFPGIGWFYYLFCGYTPRPISHFNPVNNLD
jgi:omega-3 fatty acid desaturase (delta-15 desaturase)